MLSVIVIPILIEFLPETFLQIILKLWLETENDIITETETDNKVTETDNKLVEEPTTPIVY
jgi:hypothetical protein